MIAFKYHQALPNEQVRMEHRGVAAPAVAPRPSLHWPLPSLLDEPLACEL